MPETLKKEQDKKLMPELLEAKNLSVSFFSSKGEICAVRDVSFSLRRGEVLAIVGESGCGKSALCKSIMKLLPEHAKIMSGSISVNGADITAYRERDMQRLRGKLFSMIFQDPMTSLNPTMSVGMQIEEAVRVHQPKLSFRERQERVLRLMNLVEIDRPKERLKQYPYHLSGGQRQQVVMAIALAGNPEILFADEPTTALDVTIQAQILDLLRQLKDSINSSIMLITHDLGVIAEMADYVVVMYAGRVVEKGTAEEIFEHPSHPYTIGLMASKPVVGKQVDKLYSIPGKVPNPVNMPNYCYFKDRCEMCVEGCSGAYPPEIRLSETHRVSCYRYSNGKGEQ